MRTAILFLLVFASTLRSWYFFDAGFSADNFALAAIALFALLWPHTLRSIPQTALWLALGTLIALIGGLIVTFTAQSDLIKIETPLSIAVFACAGLLASGLTSRPEWEGPILAALKYTIAVHAAFLFVQLLALLLLDQKIDFHVLVTGEASRNEGGSLDNLGLGFFYRPSGLLNEPGTYAAWILPMIVLYMAGRAYRADWVTMIGLLSVFATFSSQGVIAAVVVVGALLYMHRGWYSIVALPAFGIVAFATVSFTIWERFVMSDYLADNSARTRLDSVEAAFTTVLGNGFLFPTISIGDNTTVVYWWWYCGVFCVPLLVVFAALALRYRRELALLLFVLLTSKVPATAPFYWLIIGLGLGLAVRRRREDTTPQQAPTRVTPAPERAL